MVILKLELYGLLNDCSRNHEMFPLVEAFAVSSNIDIFFSISEMFLASSVERIYDGLNMNGCT